MPFETKPWEGWCAIRPDGQIQYDTCEDTEAVAWMALSAAHPGRSLYRMESEGWTVQQVQISLLSPAIASKRSPSCSTISALLSKAPSEMNIDELQQAIGKLQDILHRRVLGNPSQGVTSAAVSRLPTVSLSTDQISCTSVTVKTKADT